MNKKELLAELATKFHKVGTITDAETSNTGLATRKKEGIKWELVGVYEKNGDVLVRRHVSIYTENEGKNNERAFYGEKVLAEKTIKVTNKTNTFKDEVKALIEKQRIEGNMVKGIIALVSEEDSTAIVKSYTKENEEIIVKDILIYKDTEGNIEYTPIKAI